MGIIRLALGYVAVCAGLALGSFLLTPLCGPDTRPADIAVVLASGLKDRNTLGAGSQARLDAAIALVQRGQVTHLHLTGGTSSKTWPGVAEVMARDPRLHGLSVSVETASLSTLENALFSLPDLPDDASLLIVTEEFHAWRGRASMLWAGRSAHICASEQNRPTRELALNLVRETAAWGLNIGRGSVWWAAQALSLDGHLPDGFLH